MAPKEEQDQIQVTARSIPNSVLSTPTPTMTSMFDPMEKAFSPNNEHSSSFPTASNESALKDEPTWPRVRRVIVPYLGEFLGTFIFLLFALGVNAQVTLGNGQKGDWTTLCLGWGAGIALGVLVALPHGTAHLNPGVTLAMCIFRGFPILKLPLYAATQTLGAFVAAAVVYGNYSAAISTFEGASGLRTVGQSHSTAGIFGTYPAAFMSTGAAFADEFIGSAVLMFCIFAITCPKMEVPKLGIPACVGVVFVGITAALGWETGFAINPARDFGPRLLTAAVGYGSGVWTSSNHYFWVPIIAPFLGCIFGGLLFDLFLGSEKNSPINKPYMGLGKLLRRRESVQLSESAERMV